MDNISLEMLRLGASGYCCSQILALLALKAQGRENPDLVRAMAGLCNGLGDCSGPCGALSGGACVLALYAGKGADSEEENERLSLMLAELADWFAEEVAAAHGGLRCCDILGQGQCGKPDKERCGSIVARTYGRCLEILVENGFDPNEAVESPDA